MLPIESVHTALQATLKNLQANLFCVLCELNPRNGQGRLSTSGWLLFCRQLCTDAAVGQKTTEQPGSVLGSVLQVSAWLATHAVMDTRLLLYSAWFSCFGKKRGGVVSALKCNLRICLFLQGVGNTWRRLCWPESVHSASTIPIWTVQPRPYTTSFRRNSSVRSPLVAF